MGRNVGKPDARKDICFHELAAAFGAFVEFGSQVLYETITPPTLRDPQCMPQHRQLVRERLRMEIDCPTIAHLASRWSAILREHNALAARKAASMAALLREQQAARRKHLEKPLPGSPSRSYAQIADEVADLYRTGHRPLLDSEKITEAGPFGRGEIDTDGMTLDRILADYESETRKVVAALEQLAARSGESERSIEAALGPSDKLLATTASRIADFTKRCRELHGETTERDWEVTVAIMEFWGWDLGLGPLQPKIDRLRQKVARWEAASPLRPVD